MANLDIKSALKSFGLNDEEIKVYLSVLALGVATVRQIALDTNIKRTTIYLITERLIEKGIMGSYKAKYGTHYMVQSPKKLLDRLDDIKNNIQTIMPELEMIEKKDVYEPNVKYYKGKDGFVNILNNTLEKKSHEILYFGSADELNKIIGEKYVLEKYIPKRIEKKISFRQLVVSDVFSKKLKESDDKELRKTKLLPDSCNFNANLVIYLDKVVYLTSRKEFMAVVVQSKEIAELERKKFNLLWEII